MLMQGVKNVLRASHMAIAGHFIDEVREIGRDAVTMPDIMLFD